MSTNRSIINKAFREAGITEVGETPETAEFTEALEAYNDLYMSLFGNELGDPLEPVNYGTGGLTNSYALDSDESDEIDDYFVPQNVRLYLNLDEAVTLYMHPKPRPGARVAVVDNRDNLATYNLILNGNGRKVEDAATLTLSTNGLVREWFYRDDLGDWTRITDLTADTEAPLPREFDIFMQTALAVRLNPRYGAETDQNIIDILGRARKQLRARYRQDAAPGLDIGLLRLPSRRDYIKTY
jgi:hypothetical protein